MGRPVYVGVFLTEGSVKKLVENVTPAFSKVLGDHVTLAFRPSDEEMMAFHHLLGKEVEFLVTGKATSLDLQVQAVTVEGIASNNANPHITLSIGPLGKPKDSNVLLADGSTPIEPFVLIGKYDTFPSSL